MLWEIQPQRQCVGDLQLKTHFSRNSARCPPTYKGACAHFNHNKRCHSTAFTAQWQAG